MTRILGALAAVTLALALFSSPAAARCWWSGHHRHCSYARYHRVVAARPFYRYQYYDPYRYQYYPYYAYYPGPSFAYNYHACLAFLPFCW